MDPINSIFLIAVGVVALYFGSRWLVDGAIALALRYGVSRILIGLTIVAVGTSSPEAVLSIISSLEGANRLSLGNVIGANISNISLVLGLSCLLSPIVMNLRHMWREMSFFILCGPLLAFLAWDGRLDLIDAAIMFTVLIAFFYTLYKASRRNEIIAVTEGGQEVVAEAELRGSVPQLTIMILAGIILLAGGAQIIIEGSTDLARSIGVSNDIIGLTLIALGTTVPELTVTITASRKGHSDVVLGTIVGTIIINTLFVLGIGAAMVGIDTTGAGVWTGITAMIIMSAFMAILIVALKYAGKMVGLALLSMYAVYLAVLIFFSV